MHGYNMANANVINHLATLLDAEARGLSYNLPFSIYPSYSLTSLLLSTLAVCITIALCINLLQGASSAWL